MAAHCPGMFEVISENKNILCKHSTEVTNISTEIKKVKTTVDNHVHIYIYTLTQLTGIN